MVGDEAKADEAESKEPGEEDGDDELARAWTYRRDRPLTDYNGRRYCDPKN